MLGGIVYLLIFIAVLTFYIGFSTYITAFIEDFHLMKIDLNKNTHEHVTGNKRKRDRKINQYFHDAIELHKNILE